MPADEKNVNVILDRITSPLSGSFVLSWSIWNWKIILFIFSSDLTSKDKITEILNLSNWHSCFFNPLISSLVYLFLMPYLLYLFKTFTDYMKFINQLKETKTQQKINNLTKFEVETTTSLTLMLAKALGGHYDNTKALLQTVDEIIKINPHSEIKSNLIQIKTELTSITSATENTIATNKNIQEIITSRKYSRIESNLQALYSQLIDLLKFN